MPSVKDAAALDDLEIRRAVVALGPLAALTRATRGAPAVGGVEALLELAGGLRR